jgi:C-terminal processing protease CtpA/Prc
MMRASQLFECTQMTFTSSVRTFLALATLAASCAAYAAQGLLGFAVSAETDGFFSTTLKKVKISAVVHGAPAEHAGLLVGDEVESVNDVPIAGTSGSKIMDMVHAIQPGEHLRLKVLRDGVERLVDIVAGAPK